MSSDPTNDGKGESLGLMLTDTTPGITQWTEDQNLAKLLIHLRREFETNANIRECLTAQTKEERRQGILHFTEMLAFGYGGKHVVERAVDYLLDELEQMQKDGHGQYLIDTSTGKAVGPLTKEMVYQQPDFMNESGQLTKGKKVVNPSYASAIGLAKQKQERTRLALESSNGGLALEHVRNPDSILRVAREHLKAARLPEVEEGAEMVVEVGREQADGILQSPNAGFHRHELYGALLARKIISGGHKACSLISMEHKSNSKSQWYEVKVRVPASAEAATPSAPTP